jgi:hypothetical protein
MPSLYFDLLDEALSLSADASDQKVVEAFLGMSTVKRLLIGHPELKSLLLLQLALHITAPTIQAHYHFFNVSATSSKSSSSRECSEAWIDWYGQRLCSVSDWKKLVEDKNLRATG